MEEKPVDYLDELMNTPIVEEPTEEMKTLNLKKAKFDLEGLYYSLDGHNIFKRVYRYYNLIYQQLKHHYHSLISLMVLGRVTKLIKLN